MLKRDTSAMKISDPSTRSTNLGISRPLYRNWKIPRGVPHNYCRRCTASSTPSTQIPHHVDRRHCGRIKPRGGTRCHHHATWPYTDWVSSFVYTKKPNGDRRICLDPRDLSKGMKRTYHKTLTVGELTNKLSGAQVFIKLDKMMWILEHSIG